MVINSEQERLFAGIGPPLVNGAIMLPEFANGGAAKATMDTLFAGWERNEMGEMAFDVCLNTRTSSDKTAEAFHLISNKLEVGRI